VASGQWPARPIEFVPSSLATGHWPLATADISPADRIRRVCQCRAGLPGSSPTPPRGRSQNSATPGGGTVYPPARGPSINPSFRGKAVGCKPDDQAARNRPLTAAQQALAAGQVALARRMARRAAWRWPSLRDELESAAFLGLVHAAQLFDPARGGSFRQFAAWRIDRNFRDLIRNESRRPTVAFSVAGEAVSYGRVLNTEPDPPAGAALERAEEVARFLRAVPRRDATILRLIVLEGRTTEDVARRFGHGQPWGSQRCRAALAELRAVAERRA
jgi:RNA polymerase sigma factor (sigma-70 family)